MLSALMFDEDSLRTMLLEEQSTNQRFTRNRSSHTRSKSSLFFKPTVGRNQTISQCSEPNSCSVLEGEQPYPS